MENYIIMPDLRKSGGFRLKDRFEGWDLDHYKLVIEAQVTLHAFSWAYKCKTGKNFTEKFPILKTNTFASMMANASKKFFKNHMKTAGAVVNDDLWPWAWPLVRGLKYLDSVYWPLAVHVHAILF